MDPAVDESQPLRDLDRLAGGLCRGCGRPYTARETVGSIVLGFKNAPRCLACLAIGLRREPAGLRADLVARVHHRECFGRAWAIAEERDGPSADWPALHQATIPVEDGSTDPMTDETATETWDAGGIGCGELVLALRIRLKALPPGAILKLVATDPAAPEDLPAWCRLTGNPLVRASHPEYRIRRKET
jgi:tRNA 2-thiouridine synthesizing protein A